MLNAPFSANSLICTVISRYPGVTRRIIAEIAVMGASGAVSIIGRKEIEKAENPTEKKEELLDAYRTKFMNPYIAAEHGYVDEVILPEETRTKIVSAFRMLKTKKKELPHKKHGNIPL